jgi:hypothetical protein
MALARNGALADAVVVSGDEDLAQVVADAQDLGVRVTVVHVAVDGNWTISRVLRQECDDLIEIGTGHLRPFVNLLAGIDNSVGSMPGLSPLSNGHGTSTTGAIGQLQAGPHNGPPPSSPITGQPQLSSGTTAGSGLGTGSGLGSGLGSSGMGSSGMGSSGLGNSGMGGSKMGAGSGLGGTSGISGLSGLGSGLGQTPGTNGPQTSNPIHAAPTPSTAPPIQPTTGPQYTTPSPTPAPPPPPPHGPYTGPQQIAPLPVQQQNAPTLSDAVKAAHQEGQDFGESVARDAPALWLEAVLARKPRMPSDLEARLLQGSSLPIDFLLHDEVRHALRRGFWDALERSRR